MRLLLALTLTIFFIHTALHSQEPAVVFSLYDKSAEAQSIVEEEHETLLRLYDSDLEAALNDWYSMLLAIERFAKHEDVDLSGVKLWMNVFFNSDGSIKAIGYHPKRGCKNMDWPLFEALLKEFSKQYKFSKQSNKSYSHYAAALWPVELLTGNPSE